MLRPKTLQQQLVFHLILPVAALLLAGGAAGFFYSRNVLIGQWQEAAILKMSTYAHVIDMRLGEIKKYLEMYSNARREPRTRAIQDWILLELEQREGVDEVRLMNFGSTDTQIESPCEVDEDAPPEAAATAAGHHPSRTWCHVEVSPPRYDAVRAHQSVTIVSEMYDQSETVVGRLEVAVRFDYLIANVIGFSGWQGHEGFLVDDEGRVLVCTHEGKEHPACENDSIDKATLKALRENPSGTILGEGRPPENVSGFYRLQQAPWTIVLVAPGREVLAPIITFRTYFMIAGIVLVSLTALLIRSVAGRTVATIKTVSHAAGQIAAGHLDIVLPQPGSGDGEVGQLVRDFNRMASQLEERLRLKEALDVAMEIQQSLLPEAPPQLPLLDVAGRSVYCDETGGDYYDFIQSPEIGSHRLAVAVGDVVGHGIGAALLMATVRALLRSRMFKPGTLAEVVQDVNTMLCLDTRRTDSFMTLFLLLMDTATNEIKWVRAGHDPALIYDPARDAFHELEGHGTALGVDVNLSFTEYRANGWSNDQVLLIGTDGIWETTRPGGEAYGKERVRSLVRAQHHRPAGTIIESILASLTDFRQTVPQHDDITLVVVKGVNHATTRL
ncbi:MAG: SpoIIE family protein phosphatase [Syntrophobacteraceae bacterium]